MKPIQIRSAVIEINGTQHNVQFINIQTTKTKITILNTTNYIEIIWAELTTWQGGSWQKRSII